jgi:flagellar basal-body rod protein FlgG
MGIEALAHPYRPEISEIHLRQEAIMLRSIDMSRAGMFRLEQAMDITAHNVANANTPGYKAVRAALENGDVGPAADTGQATGPVAQPLTANIITNRLFTQGELVPTGTPSDMAISGEGFFIVKTPDGQQAYTRNGQFQPDASGQLVDTAGNVLQPGITFPPRTVSVRIAADGAVSAETMDGLLKPAGRIQIARFVNQTGLVIGAGGLYTPTAASGAPITGAPGANGSGIVQTGMYERGNTDIAEEMSTLINMQRAYQMNSSAFRMSDDMLRMASEMARG